MSDDPREKPAGKDQPGAESAPADDEIPVNPVKELLILAVLYLPLAFFLWFFFASALMAAPGRLTEWLLTGLFPGVFEQIVQLGFQFEIQTSVVMPQAVEGRTALLNLHVNPMIYAWGMAVMTGLILATPMGWLRRVGQIAVAYLVVSLVIVWGVFWEAWRDLAFLMGPAAAATVDEVALTSTVIALCYQLGYLMFPAVIPVAAWILMNRDFVERVVTTRRS